MSFNSLKNIMETVDDAGVQLYGNRRILVFDCKCVLDFSENCVVLCLGAINMKIRGDNLVLSTFAYGQTDITGDIVSIEFERI